MKNNAMSNAFFAAMLVLKNSLFELSDDIPVEIDQKTVLTILRQQAVSAIPSIILKELAKSQHDKLQIIQNASLHIANAQMHLREQDELTHLFTSNSVDFVILKGLAVARYYPDPRYRTLGDIDIAVEHNEYETAHQLMLENGYQEVKCKYEKHSVFKKHNIMFELHKYFTSSNDTMRANQIEELIQKGIRNPLICELDGVRFPVLPPLADGIMLLEHMSQHLESGIGLRHITDWMMYVLHELNDDIWQFSFAKTADAAGLRKLAEVSTLFCVKYLGLTGVTWCNNADEKACDKLLEHIITRGNFGRGSIDTSDKARKVLSTHQNFLDILNYLQSSGMKTIPYVQEHKMLHPFAWLFRSIKLLMEYRKDGKTINSMRTDVKAAQEIDVFLEDLGVRRITKGHSFWDGEKFIIKK